MPGPVKNPVVNGRLSARAERAKLRLRRGLARVIGVNHQELAEKVAEFQRREADGSVHMLSREESRSRISALLEEQKRVLQQFRRAESK